MCNLVVAQCDVIRHTILFRHRFRLEFLTVFNCNSYSHRWLKQVFSMNSVHTIMIPSAGL